MKSAQRSLSAVLWPSVFWNQVSHSLDNLKTQSSVLPGTTSDSYQRDSKNAAPYMLEYLVGRISLYSLYPETNKMR